MNKRELPIDSDTCDETPSASEVLMKSVSPDAKKRAKYRLKLDPPASDSVKRDLRLDRISIPSEKKCYTKLKVEEFMLQDVNSIVVPDIKASKKNLRYMLMSRRDLHQKYLVDMDHSCSYEQFCRYIPDNVIKPKPEDWGTCLCKTCLNPELKLDCIKQLLPEVSFDLNETNIDNADNILIGVCDEILKSNLKFEYLEWSTETIKKKAK